MDLEEKISQLKKKQLDLVGLWDEYDKLGEVIEELEWD